MTQNRRKIIEEGLKSRLQILGITELDLINDKGLRDIVKDEDKFNRCIKSIILYYTKEVVDKKEMTEFAKNFSFIGKSNRLFRILTIIDWLENELGVNRFEFAEMEVTNRIKKLTTEDRIKKFCMDIINQFDEFYSYTSKKTGNRNIIVYSDFVFNKNILKNHSKIINCLHMDQDKFTKSMKNNILKNNSVDNIEFLKD